MLDNSFPAVSPASGDEARLDELHGVLSHRRRRVVLGELDEVEGPLSLDELAERVVRSEAQPPFVDVPEDDVEAVRISLYHTHLPKLAESNLVEYAPLAGTAEFSTPTGEG